MAWIGSFDASMINTLDSLVEEDGRRFVRHYLIDFGASFGSGTNRPRSPDRGSEGWLELGRTMAALVTLGAYQRDWQKVREDYDRMVARYPSIGWYPAEGWEPEDFRTIRRVPAHLRMTDRDAYWAAKVITSFTDDQIRAAVSTGRYPQDAARHLAHALRVRRDTIGRVYLTRVTAVEEPRVSDDGRTICFVDLAIRRGAARAVDVTYHVSLTDAKGRMLAPKRRVAGADEPCVTFDPRADAAYRVMHVRASVHGRSAKTSRVHVAWRPEERRHVVVGLERDE
jgi:hypothetical protein